jgi:anti-sigma-K factor RskA
MVDPMNSRKVLTDADIALAGEYALGLLSGADLAAIETRIATDAIFAAEVEAWRARLGPLAYAGEVLPDAALWDRIDAATPIAPAAPASKPRAAIPPQQPANDNRLIWWKAATGAGFATAAALALMLINQPTAIAPNPGDIAAKNPPMVAALASDTGRMAMTATFDPGGKTLVMTPVGVNTGNLYPELWLIPASGPRKGEAISLGMVQSDRPHRLLVPVAYQAMIENGATLAITPEPAGGAPGGKATGPIILKGVMTTT